MKKYLGIVTIKFLKNKASSIILKEGFIIMIIL